MPCRVVVEGDLVTLHVTLGDPRSRTGAREFPEVFEPTEGSHAVGQLGGQSEAGQAKEADAEQETAAEAKQTLKELEDELTDEARRLLASEDVEVTLTWKRGSLEVAALIACGKIVADVGAFLTGVREIRALVPQRIRERISAWLGRDVALRRVRLEMETGMLRGKAEKESAADGDSESRPFSVTALRSYAALSLAVLVVVALLVGGVALLI
jgi:hypothetical protein